MDEQCKLIIETLMKFGAPSPTTLVKLADDFEIARKRMQFTLQIGLERGLWHLNEDMHVAEGPPNYAQI